MMKRALVVVLLTYMAAVSLASAQTQPISAPTGQKTLAATINVYVFPEQGQAPERQSKDEANCYGWAVQNTKTDPFDLAKQAEQKQQQAEQAKQQIDQAGKGAGAKGALAGAAVGALIGEIADDKPGEGAAAGAAVGAIAARRKARRAKSQAKAQVDAQSQQAQAFTKEQIENFKKAFSVCLEANKYMVKY